MSPPSFGKLKSPGFHVRVLTSVLVVPSSGLGSSSDTGYVSNLALLQKNCPGLLGSAFCDPIAGNGVPERNVGTPPSWALRIHRAGYFS